MFDNVVLKFVFVSVVCIIGAYLLPRLAGKGWYKSKLQEEVRVRRLLKGEKVWRKE